MTSPYKLLNLVVFHVLDSVLHFSCKIITEKYNASLFILSVLFLPYIKYLVVCFDDP